jgi:sirohydrochlorin cobaltochelatase
MTTALIIAGHGSHLSAQTAAPAWQHADTIRAMGVFDEVTCAFWKEFPSLRRVVDTLTADDITIVPLFTSQGYFSRTVLPSELQLDGPITQRDGRIIRYADTVGQHPHMTDVVRARAGAVLSKYQLDPTKTALALAGHGTKRDPASAAATRQQVEIMRQEARFAEVVAIYMDEPPEIETVYAITQAPSIIIVPFFVADGSHTQEDIPTDLGISSDPRRLGYSVPTEIAGRAVYYTPAVGMETSVANVLLELAVAAGASLKEVQPNQDHWAGFPQAGLAELELASFPLEFGELLIRHQADNFIVSHKSDADSPQVLSEIHTPSELRSILLFDSYGNYRALATGKDLPRGWSVSVSGYESLLAVLEVIYPSSWIDRAQWQEGNLPIQTIEQVSSRQKGMYEHVGKLSPELLPDLVKTHCGACSRVPTWYDPQAVGTIPCPEPCQFFMSFALQQVASRRAGQLSLELSPAEIDSLMVALQAMIDEVPTDVRPYEYDDPRNPFRLRALRERLSKLRKTPNSPTESDT